MKVDRRNFLKEGAAAGILALGAASAQIHSAHASAPLAGNAQSGAIRRKLGDFEVTALLDGHIGVNDNQIVGYSEVEAASLRKEAFLPAKGPINIPVSAYLVNTGSKLVLIDAGAATAFGENVGHINRALAAANVKPEQVDAVVITHLHPDHVFGLLDGKGGKAFPNAEIIVTEEEHKFWHDDANIVKPMKQFFDIARNSLKPYQKNVTRISGEKEIIPGIRAMPLPGHTPGQTGVMISSAGQSLFLVADLLHVSALQFARPDWSIVFDMDKEAAVKTRKRVLQQIASDRLFIAGSHLPFPGFGNLLKNGDGFRFVPAEWQYA